MADTRTHLATLLVLVVIFGTAKLLVAHERQAHVNITTAAIEHLRLTDPDRHAAIMQIGAGSFDKAINSGPWREDDFFSVPYYPLFGRFFFHFLNPAGPLNDVGQASTCTSLEWGTLPHSCDVFSLGFTLPAPVVNDHSWAL